MLVASVAKPEREQREPTAAETDPWRSPFETLQLLRNEVKLFRPEMEARPHLIVLNKVCGGVRWCGGLDCMHNMRVCVRQQVESVAHEQVFTEFRSQVQALGESYGSVKPAGILAVSVAQGHGLDAVKSALLQLCNVGEGQDTAPST